jgi:hypothetical protein
VANPYHDSKGRFTSGGGSGHFGGAQGPHEATTRRGLDPMERADYRRGVRSATDQRKKGYKLKPRAVETGGVHIMGAENRTFADYHTAGWNAVVNRAIKSGTNTDRRPFSRGYVKSPTSALRGNAGGKSWT